MGEKPSGPHPFKDVKTLPHPEIRVYRDDCLEYRWRLVSTNRKIIADSAEGYRTRAGAKRSARNLMLTAPLAGIVSI